MFATVDFREKPIRPILIDDLTDILVAVHMMGHPTPPSYQVDPAAMPDEETEGTSWEGQARIAGEPSAATFA